MSLPRPKPIPLVDLTRQARLLKGPLGRSFFRVMARGTYILGPEVAHFEEAFAKVCHARFGVGVASGTDALELALRALGVGSGDRVITVSFTFLSTAEAIRRVGAIPLFVDVDPSTYTMDPGQVERLLKRIKPWIRRRIKAILPVHLFGHPCDLPALAAIARREGWWMIEDCAQAHGASWEEKPVGSWGELGCFSFYPSKALGGFGDGGMVVTSSPSLAHRLKVLRFQGRQGSHLQVMEGLNSRLDELQAALLATKLKYLRRWIQARRRWAARYTEQLRGLPVQAPVERPPARHVFTLYVIQSPRRDSLQEALARNRISTSVHYRIPIHRQPLYRRIFQENPVHLPVTERLAKRVLSLPLFPEMKEAEFHRVCSAIASAF